jgi:hypothetical protein
MSYVLLLYTVNQHQVEVITKAIGPFDTEDEAMGRPEVQDQATYSGAAVVTVTSPEDT